MGAVSPGRWQPWQFFTRMGATSLLNVTCDGLAILLGAAAASRVARLAINPKAIVFITVASIIRVDRRKSSSALRVPSISESAAPPFPDRRAGDREAQADSALSRRLASAARLSPAGVWPPRRPREPAGACPVRAPLVRFAD